MGVEVHLAVGRVDEAVQALPSVLIGQLGGDDDEVLAVSVESVQLNTRSVVFRLDFLAVDDDRFDLAVEQVRKVSGSVVENRTLVLEVKWVAPSASAPRTSIRTWYLSTLMISDR